MPSQSLYEINGDEPLLVGQVCTGLVLQQFHRDLRLMDQVNVAYLRLGDQWVCLYFECATIFWRPSESPVAAQNDSLAYGLLLNDLSGMDSVVGQEIRSVAYAGFEAGDVQVTFVMANGVHMVFAYSCALDSTALSIAAPAPGG